MNDDGATRCLNCRAVLTGPWCANCGQKHEPEIHTFAHFAGEALENVTHADSRLWQTLWILVSRPGLLTREFFSGRRMRYLPPVRFYLVMSVVFFLLAEAVSEHGQSFFQVPAADKAAPAADGPGNEAKSCDDLKYDGPFHDFVLPRLPVQCRKFMADNGRGLARAFFANLPKALFVLLPLLAAFMMLLYWQPRRYYVEHLLLLLHNHIFLFIVYGLLLALGLAFPDSSTVGVVGLLSQFYLAWYFYRAMREVYGQGRALSMMKFVLLGSIYVLGAIIVFALTVAVSAVTF